jgi:hypothetical protein
MAFLADVEAGHVCEKVSKVLQISILTKARI